MKIKQFIITVLFGLFVVLNGCGSGSQQKAIEEMVETLVEAIDRGDEELAMECLLDQSGFAILNPDLGTRTREVADETLGSLIGNFSRLASHFDGREVIMKEFTLGHFWDQYKNRPGFYKSKALLEVDGEEFELIITAIIRIADDWYIIDLSGNNF